MSISIGSTANASATAWLSKQLKGAGVSSAAADAVSEDLLDAAKASLTASPTESDEDFQGALDKQIDQDVSAGKLSQQDADKIKDALQNVPGTSLGQGASTASQSAGSSDAQAGTGTDGSASERGGDGDGDGGGASSSKVEVSETVTVSGAVKTTVITYSDGSTATERSVASSADLRKYDHNVRKGDGKDAGASTSTSQAAESARYAQAAKDYLAQLPPGTLFQKVA